MEKPLVSIVIPAYNASNYLSEAIDSALAQTYGNYEIIVVNDGSPDDGATRAVALSYGDKIRYYEKENGGCASALNFGISKMKGEWFSWLSHDDLYLPEKLEKLMSLIERYELDPDKVVLGCNDFVMGSDKQTKHNIFNNSSGVISPEKAFGETLNVKTFNGCGLLIPKTVLKEVGEFRTDYKHLLDRELWMRIALAGYSYCFADEPLVISRAHGQQITVKAQDSLFGEEEKLISSYFKALQTRKVDSGFMMQLCFFSYKRKHYALAKKIKNELQKNGKLAMAERMKMIRFVIEGKAKALIRNSYKKWMRR